MQRIWFLFYNLFVLPLMWLTFNIMQLWNEKVRKGLKGRNGMLKRLEAELIPFESCTPRFWIHNSSMGEFEQAKPIIGKLKEDFPDCFIIVTFFSPSGYEHTKEYNKADILTYIPFDSYFKAKKFIDMVKPDMALMIKYDLWPNHLWYLKKRSIPVALVNASARPAVLSGNGLLKKFFIPLYKNFAFILTISDEAKKFINSVLHEPEKVFVTGDTRYDQVVSRAESAENDVENLRKIMNGRKCFVAGSTWPSDEKELIPALKAVFERNIKFWVVLVPHEPTEEHINQLQIMLDRAGLTYILFSSLKENSDKKSDVLIVDTVGILASLYSLADMAYVGGGFAPGVHSVLEPAAFGKVVLFGPKHTNSFEANRLLENGGGIVVRDNREIEVVFTDFFGSESAGLSKGEKAGQLVRENLGATERIVSHIKSRLKNND